VQLPVRNVLGRRVEWSAVFLGATEQPIVEVAHAVGFCSQAHQTTMFQSVYGTTTVAYRRQLRPEAGQMIATPSSLMPFAAPRP
jgi:transcriptional regulator GlxA family with amidase domain